MRRWLGKSVSNLPDLDWWIKNGGAETLKSYGSCNGTEVQVFSRAHLQWIATLPLLHVDRHRIFVHAAVDPEVPLDQQSEQTLLWKRYLPRADVGHGNRHVVHAHHAMAGGPILMNNKTNLDTLAWKTGRLVVGVFEDKAGGPTEILEITARGA